jgi:polyferredoxin
LDFIVKDALSFADPDYTISVIVLIFFLIPLIFTLFFGRSFCAAGCPLGAIQDLIIIKPLSLPSWLRKTLGIIPYIYLGLAVLYAVTKTDFIICRYDPFVGIFRMDAPFHMVVLGISFLLIGMFMEYCLTGCPGSQNGICASLLRNVFNASFAQHPVLLKLLKNPQQRK